MHAITHAREYFIKHTLVTVVYSATSILAGGSSTSAMDGRLVLVLEVRGVVGLGYTET